VLAEFDACINKLPADGSPVIFVTHYVSFLIAPGISFALFAGSMAALAAEKLSSNWSTKFLVIAASGIIAGESCQEYSSP